MRTLTVLGHLASIVTAISVVLAGGVIVAALWPLLAINQPPRQPVPVPAPVKPQLEIVPHN